MSARPAMPSLAQIAVAWINLTPEDLQTTFPELPALAIGWGRDQSAIWVSSWRYRGSALTSHSGSRTARCSAWRGPPRSGWLERGHLHDHDRGGSNEPLNFAPLWLLRAHADAGRFYADAIARAGGLPS